MTAAVRGLRPHFPPPPLDARRQRARYSDTNYQLLIAVIETVTGRALPAAFEERLFQPLALRHTHVAGHPRPGEPEPEPATVWLEHRPLELALAMSSARDLVSTADDLLRFMGLSSGETSSTTRRRSA